MANTIRAFVALKLPADIIEHAAGLQAALKAKGLRLRWVKPQNIHLTLKFLGDIPAADAAMVGPAMQRASQGTPPLALFVQGMGVFPGIKRPRVLWIGLGGEVEALRQLNSRIEDELAGLGFARENRGFKAHLTLARFKEGVASRDLLQAFEALGNYTPEPFAAKHLVLYKSDLRPQGALYTPLAEVLLDQDRR
jgi:2'-5' RNA ligase